MEDSDHIDIQIKNAELKRIIAEADKSEAEKKKIDIERIELEKPLYKKLRFLQAIIAGIVGGLALLGVFQGIIEPTYKKDIIEKELEIAQSKKTIYSLKDSIQQAKDSIKQSEISIKEIKEKNKIILDSIGIEKNISAKLLVENKKKENEIREKQNNIIAQRKRTIEIINDQIKKNNVNTGVEQLVISTIYFDYDKSILTEDSKRLLDKVVKFLLTYVNIIAELDGYSYVKGSDMYNMKLSERRANAVKAYIVNNGISDKRIMTVGFGEDRINSIITARLDEELEKKLYELYSVVKIKLIIK